jgi:cytochrome c oxidase cbb3-type subunit II
MNRSLTIALGIMLTVVLSMAGLVLIPNWQFREMQQHKDDDGNLWPVQLEGAEALGRAEYVSLGCVYCHTQQVRPPNYGADLDRGWGFRRTVPRDYLFDSPHLLGTMRTGPDLANIGSRQPSRDWHMLHLYDPVITSPGSTMPPHRFLFEKVAPTDRAPERAIRLPDDSGWILPSARAESLFAYLRSLDKSYELPEAPQ